MFHVRHHGGKRHSMPDQEIDDAVNVVEGNDPDGTSEAWLREQIDRITQELGD